MSEEKKAEVKEQEVDVIDELFGGDESLPTKAEQAPADAKETGLPAKKPDSDDAKKEKQEPEPKPKEEAPEPEKKVATDEPKKDEVFQQQIEELEAQLEASDKRVRDNQSSYHKEHALRLELEKRIADLEKQKKSDDEFGFLDDDEPDPAPKKDEKKAEKVDVEKIKEEVKNEVTEQVSQTLSQEKWNEAESAVKAEHDDYDSLIDDVLLPALEKSDALKEEYSQMGATPENAYKLAQKVKDRQEFAKDPDAYLARKNEELKLKTKAPEAPEKKKSTGLSENSDIAPSGKPPKGDILDEIYG